jgi:DNA-binding CsgD family transcriptional regulator/DNA-binding transcriptional regulator YiaG
MKPSRAARAQAQKALGLLSETSSTAERIRGLRALNLRVADVALACDVSEETVRNWSNGREPNARGQRLLDRLRYSASLVLEEEGDVGRAGAWLTSATEELDGQSPVEVFAPQHRDVMRLASAHVFALHDARHDPPPSTVVEVVSESPRDEDGRRPRRRRRRASLSPVQARIARMLQDGRSITEIADALQISQEAISEQLGQVREAFGLRDIDAIHGVASDALSRAVAEAASKRDP